MDPYPKHIPRTPGAWRRGALVQRYLVTVMIGSSGLGALVLWVALTAIPASAGSVANGVFIFWGVGAGISFLVIRHGFGNYGAVNLEKGLAAETLIGRRIEAAITRPNHAVAHNLLIGAAELGDIDHLVATPEGLVVVEAKFTDLPEDRFSEVRHRLARSIKAVREWAPPGTRVRGAIVYMSLEHREREYPTLGEDIRVYESKRFAREFRLGMETEATLPHVRQVRRAGLLE